MIKIVTPNQIVTINVIMTEVRIFNFKMADGRHIGRHCFGYNSAAQIVQFLRNFVRICKIRE